MNIFLCYREKASEWGVVVGGGREMAFSLSEHTCERSFAPSPLLRPEGFPCCKKKLLIGKEVENMVEPEEKSLQSETKVTQNRSQLRRCLLEIWDAVIDLQDQIATAVALSDHQDPGISAETAWVYRPGREPEKVNLIEYAREVLGIE